MSNQSRRKFLTSLAALPLAGLALTLFGRKALAEEKRRGGGAAAGGGDLALPQVVPGQGMAISLNYVNKAADLKDAKLKTERQGVPFAKQNCSGCALYTKVGSKDGAELGKCSIFAGQLVHATGWCTTWNKKA